MRRALGAALAVALGVVAACSSGGGDGEVAETSLPPPSTVVSPTVSAPGGPAPTSGPTPEELALSGGEGTVFDTSATAFALPLRDLSILDRRAFAVGNNFFNDNWVTAPASTEGRDGLGPTFNAQSCSSCHFHDGRAKPPESVDDPELGLLLRLSVPGPDGTPQPVPCVRRPAAGSSHQRGAGGGDRPPHVHRRGRPLRRRHALRPAGAHLRARGPGLRPPARRSAGQPSPRPSGLRRRTAGSRPGGRGPRGGRCRGRRRRRHLGPPEPRRRRGDRWHQPRSLRLEGQRPHRGAAGRRGVPWGHRHHHAAVPGAELSARADRLPRRAQRRDARGGRRPSSTGSPSTRARSRCRPAATREPPTRLRASRCSPTWGARRVIVRSSRQASPTSRG